MKKARFEKHKICEVLGDIYGNPLDISFKRNTSFWKEILQQIGKRNQFLIAEKKTGISVEELVDYIYDQEISGNVDKMPARKRILFLKSNYDELPKGINLKIIQESKRVEAFKLRQLQELHDLCKSEKEPAEYIAEVLNVPCK